LRAIAFEFAPAFLKTAKPPALGKPTALPLSPARAVFLDSGARAVEIGGEEARLSPPCPSQSGVTDRNGSSGADKQFFLIYETPILIYETPILIYETPIAKTAWQPIMRFGPLSDARRVRRPRCRAAIAQER
jgi:hypothetical protein